MRFGLLHGMEDTKACWADRFLKIPSDRCHVPMLLEHMCSFACLGGTADLTLKASKSLLVLRLIIRALPCRVKSEENLEAIKSMKMKVPDLPQSLVLHDLMLSGASNQALPKFWVLQDDSMPMGKVKPRIR